MHQAALKNHCDPDKLSFVEAVRVVICRKITAAHFPLRPMEMKRLRREIIDEITQRKNASSSD